MDEISILFLHDFYYEASWRDFWTGFQLDWQPFDNANVSASANYHLGRFNAHGHWRLNETLTDGFNFENHGKVRQSGIYQGLSGKVQIDYIIPCTCWVLTLDCGYYYFLKTQGSDRTKTHEVVTMDDGTVISDGFNSYRNIYHVASRAVVVAAGVKYDF